MQACHSMSRDRRLVPSLTGRRVDGLNFQLARGDIATRVLRGTIGLQRLRQAPPGGVTLAVEADQAMKRQTSSVRPDTRGRYLPVAVRRAAYVREGGPAT